MNNTERLSHVVEEIDYLRAERNILATEGPHFRVIHGGHQRETLCLHGEIIEQICLVHRWNLFPLPLSPTGLSIMDCFCRNRLKPLTASRIAQILATDPFYTRQGANLGIVKSFTSSPNRSVIKVYVQRIQRQMASTFDSAGLLLDPTQVLISKATEKNAVAYTLRASVEFVHRP
jgi:hypothetical protein